MADSGFPHEKEFDLDALVPYDEDFRKLIRYGRERGVRFMSYAPRAGWRWAFVYEEETRAKTVYIPISREFQCVLPIYEFVRGERKFKLAHELGHAASYDYICKVKECDRLRRVQESCFFEEWEAWVVGLNILKELSLVSSEEEKDYRTLAYDLSCQQGRLCILRQKIDRNKQRAGWK